jgi:hypothetical protein
MSDLTDLIAKVRAAVAKATPGGQVFEHNGGGTITMHSGEYYGLFGADLELLNNAKGWLLSLCDAAEGGEKLAPEGERAMAWRVTAEACGKVRDALKAEVARLTRERDEACEGESQRAQERNEAVADAAVYLKTGLAAAKERDEAKRDRDEAERQLRAIRSLPGLRDLSALRSLLALPEGADLVEAVKGVCVGLDRERASYVGWRSRALGAEARCGRLREENERLERAVNGLATRVVQSCETLRFWSVDEMVRQALESLADAARAALSAAPTTETP